MKHLNTNTSVEFRRFNHKQALSTAEIEGFKPSKVFLDECNDVISGKISHTAARYESLRRALANEKDGRKKT